MSWKAMCPPTAVGVALFIGYKVVVRRSEGAWTSSNGSLGLQPVPLTVAPKRRPRLRLPAALRLAFWSGVIGGILLLSGFIGFPGTTAGETATATFTATEDTFVLTTSPNSNYGQASTLQLDKDAGVKRALVGV